MRKGEKSIRVQLLRWWVRDRKLTPVERMSSRIGYMGCGIFNGWAMDSRTYFIHNWFLLCIFFKLQYVSNGI